MNQNIFCTKCHRIPSQCVCGNTQCELTDAEILEVCSQIEPFDDITIEQAFIEFARAILRKASEK
jgi:hypothetical protein